MQRLSMYNSKFYLLCEPPCEERDEVLEVIFCKTLYMRLDEIHLHLFFCIL
jgi:hypothetical protein